MGPVRASDDDSSRSSGVTADGSSSTCDTTASLAAEAEKAFRERQRLEEEMESLASFLTSEGQCRACHGDCFIRRNPFRLRQPTPSLRECLALRFP